VELITSRFLYGPVQPPDGYAVAEPFYRLSTRVGRRSRLRLPLKALEHVPQMLLAGRRSADADVAHWQWVTWPPIDRYLVAASGHPRVITLHYPLPARADRRGLRSQRAFLSRFDAVVSHTTSTIYYTYDSLQLYFKNGGGKCYIVSIGNYDTTPTKSHFEDGLAEPKKQDEPTMIVFPDAATAAARSSRWSCGPPGRDGPGPPRSADRSGRFRC